MRIFIETYNEVIGFHRWGEAPPGVGFLDSLHRHRFEIRCRFEVGCLNRELEIFMKEREILKHLSRHLKDGEYFFGQMSCEMMAKEIIDGTGCARCQVLEDGKGGAVLVRQQS